MFVTYVILIILVFCERGICGTNVKKKRLVLHSEQDTAAELVKLRQQFTNLTAHLTTTMNVQAQKIHDLETTVNVQAQTIQDQNTLVQKLTDTVGGERSSYTRWGRTTCPGNGSTLIYSGFMAGTFYDKSNSFSAARDGDGANYLCLSDNPTWDHYVNTVDNQILITGVEYEFDPFHQTMTQFLGRELFGDQAPCAVCHVTRGINIMIPGRTDCYPGWTKEYSGYIATGYPGFDDSSECICLDRRPEAVVNSGKPEKSNVLYFVEAHCSSGLECPPYVDGRELACVVCSA